MKSFLNISLALVAKALLVCFIVKGAWARSFQRIIGDSVHELNNIMEQQPLQTAVGGNVVDLKESAKFEHGLFGAAEHSSRSKRDTSTESCRVHPDTPVILNGFETYLEFDQDEIRPVIAGENDKPSCPRAPTGDWWPGEKENLRATCPWYWKIFDTRTLRSRNGKSVEVYPRFIKQAKCICSNCVHADTMMCRPLMKNHNVYRKIGCDGDKPVFEESELPVAVGCYCLKPRQ